jgi:hypothetical protein
MTDTLSPQNAAREFIDNWFSPWGSWKTAWWESFVGDDIEMTGDEAMVVVRKLLARTEPPKPAPSAEGVDIEAIKREAYKQGWSDREGDLLCAMDRIYPPSPGPETGVEIAEEASFAPRCPSCGVTDDDHAPDCACQPLSAEESDAWDMAAGLISKEDGQ